MIMVAPWVWAQYQKFIYWYVGRTPWERAAIRELRLLRKLRGERP